MSNATQPQTAQKPVSSQPSDKIDPKTGKPEMKDQACTTENKDKSSKM